MTKNCQNRDLKALEAYFSLNGLKYNILMVLDTSQYAHQKSNKLQKDMEKTNTELN